MNVVEIGICTRLTNLDISQYRTLLGLTLTVNVFMMFCQLVNILVDTEDFMSEHKSLTKDGSFALSVMSLVALCLLFSDSTILFKLMYWPNTRAVKVAGVLVVLLIGVYIIQSIIYYGLFSENSACLTIEVPFLIIILLIQAFSLVVLYR